MKKIIFLSCLLVFVGGIALPPGDAHQPKEFKKLMLDKLRYSQLLLEGLAMGDFAKISRSAEELVLISRNAEWMVYKTPRYELHSNEFRRAAETVIQKAKAKNLDGAALGYFDLTMSCLRCHQHVREIREVRLPAPGPALAWSPGLPLGTSP